MTTDLIDLNRTLNTLILIVPLGFWGVKKDLSLMVDPDFNVLQYEYPGYFPDLFMVIFL